MTTVTVRVDALAHGGAGVGAVEQPGSDLDQKRVFIQGTLPGEQVQAQLHVQKKRYAKGSLTEVIKASPQRVEPPCAMAQHCGGCNWQHIDPSVQAEHKAEIALGQLRGVVSAFDAIYPAPQALGYRRRARLHVQREEDGLKIGFFAHRSKEVVSVQHCPVLVEPLSEVLAWLPALAPWLGEKSELHLLEGSGQVIVGVAGRCPRPEDKPELEDLVRAGPHALVGLSFRGGRRSMRVGQAQVQLRDAPASLGVPALMAGPFDFAQAQATQNERLLEVLSRWVGKLRGEVLELYCGSGNLTRVLASPSRKVVAWDLAQGSILALSRMARTQGLSIVAHRGKAIRALSKAKSLGRPIELLVVDPPRTGMGAAICEAIVELGPSAIAYVSCDPATLSRDLSVLVERGYRCERAVLVDLMPMTSEMELMVWLTKGSSGSATA